jgi:hypothetical protein
MPASVTSIGISAFSDCINLVSVTFLGTIPSGKFKIGKESYPTFPGDLRDKFYAANPDNGTPGTYNRATVGDTWALQ